MRGIPSFNVRPVRALPTVAIVLGAFAAPALAQSPDTLRVPGAKGNLLNPAISVMGWIQAEGGSEEVVEETFSLKEAELGFQSVVDPYLRADYFIAVSPAEGIDLEEGYFTFLALPKNVGLKAGKFRSNLGRFNRIHPPETAFADRPLVHEVLFGEEGLAATGASLSFLVPNPLGIYLNLDAEVTSTPEGHAHEEGGGEAEAPAVFEPAGPRDLLYLARLGAFFEIGEAANLSLGGSFADGASGFLPDSGEARRNQIAAVDLTVRWKNPRRAIYRSFTWWTEGYLFRPDDEGLAEELDARRGVFSYVNAQFARRWHVGVRGDWTELVETEGHEAGGLAYLTFTPSEFSLISFQGRHVHPSGGSSENQVFLKCTASIGPHGAHLF